MIIENNRYLFLICAGLTASGSDGYDHNDSEIAALAGRIHAAGFPNGIKAWFARARTGQVAVNPYWPRGSELAAACFFIDEQYEFDTGAFFAFLRSTDSTGEISDPIGVDDLIEWIAGVPDILRALDAHPATAGLWEEYCRIIEARRPGWEEMVHKAVYAAKKFFGDAAPEMVFNPNLFTPYSADFVRVGKRIVTISYAPDAETMLHETMHTAVAAYRDKIMEFAAVHGLGGFADRDKMMEFGYMQDDSAGSAAHVIEECFVRALAVTLAGGSMERLSFHAEYGCSAVPVIAACIRDMGITGATLGRLVEAVLGETGVRGNPA